MYSTIWLVNSTLYFFPLVRNASSLIIINSCVREELSDIMFFLQPQLQQITVGEHFFVQFKRAHLKNICAPPQLTISPSPTTCAVDYLQRLIFGNSQSPENFTGNPKIVNQPTSSQEIWKHKPTFTFTLCNIYKVNDTA